MSKLNQRIRSKIFDKSSTYLLVAQKILSAEEDGFDDLINAIQHLIAVQRELKEDTEPPVADANAPKLFDIGHPNLRDIIKKDPNRTEQNKENDIAFYDAKVDGRYGKLAGTQDQNFKNKIERKMKRIQKEEDLRLKEKERIAKTIPVNADEVDMIDLDLETHDQNENNEACWIDIEEPEAKRPRREEKSEYISINLPRKTLCKLTAPLARRYKISPRAQTAFLAKIIKIGHCALMDSSIFGM